VPFAPLLLAHSLRQSSLVLEVRRRQVWKRILIEDGVPVDCRSNLAHETLGRFMVAEGKLGEEDFTACLSRSASRGVPFGEILIEHGLVTATDLFRILQQNLAKKLLDLFTWNEGELRWLDEAPASASSLKVKVPQLILTGVTRFAPQEEVDMSVAPLVGKKLLLHPRPPFPFDDLRLSRHQSQIVEALRPPGRRMGELAELTQLPVDEITRVLYALSILGVVTTADALPRELAATGPIPRPAVAPPPPPAATVPVPAPAAADPELERRRNEIMQAYLSYRRQDAFDLLGAPEDGTPAVFEERFLDFARRFSPWTLPAGDLAEKARDLLLTGARGYAELADAEQRNTLLFRRKTLREERAKKPTASFAIKTDLLDSESQYKKGKTLMDTGKHREALMLLEFAADCDPQNSLYAAELAYCRFLVTSANASRALKELNETLRRDPNCGLAAFYAGEIERQVGNTAEAEAHLRRAIKLMSPDRRPIEALKSLSTERRR
ncbi:MAG TPA: tetratricopeptide repeat protein, partial [Thermoanaerobaculia bacterium]|nr:tetratricopeptide repeat protein [Thermoanaerobaculia bacterium]